MMMVGYGYGYYDNEYEICGSRVITFNFAFHNRESLGDPIKI